MSINNPGDQTGDSDNGPHGEKKSLMSKMKDKAKDKMHKLKTKLKKDKDSDASEGTEEDTDHFDSDAQVCVCQLMSFSDPVLSLCLSACSFALVSDFILIFSR